MEKDNMDVFLLWLLYIGLGIIALYILWRIISDASRSKSIKRELKLQSAYLKEMALKNGVTEERIAEILIEHPDE